MTNPECSFCNPSPEDIIAAHDLAYLRWDIVPEMAARGVMLATTKLHVTRWFSAENPLDAQAQNDFFIAAYHFTLSPHILQLITERCGQEPQAFNLGLDDGPAAGQIEPHPSWKIIPRFEGDSDDPRGGIRQALPDPTGYLGLK